MRHKFIGAFMLLCVFSQAALAADMVKRFIPDAQIVGAGRLTVMLWDVYDATLYAPGGIWSVDKPFVLSLHYLRDLSGNDIADRSVQEMRGQGFRDEVALAAWHAQMKAIFPDVNNGTTLSAVFIPGQHTEFFENNKRIGTIKGDAFLRQFSSIWLSKKTSEPALRQELLGDS